MGNAVNLSPERILEASPEDIAEFLPSIGETYRTYCDLIVHSGINGDVLSEFRDQKNDYDFKQFLKDIGITNVAHQLILCKHFRAKFPPSAISPFVVKHEAKADTIHQLLKKYQAFLTHDWGVDTLNRANHLRVTRINSRLKARGIKTWFDEEKIQNNIWEEMAKGIEDSDCVVVFVTKNYYEKVNGKNDRDNCKVSLFYISFPSFPTSSFISWNSIMLQGFWEEAK
jgi:hypothetical protein